MSCTPKRPNKIQSGIDHFLTPFPYLAKFFSWEKLDAKDGRSLYVLIWCNIFLVY